MTIETPKTLHMRQLLATLHLKTAEGQLLCARDLLAEPSSPELRAHAREQISEAVASIRTALKVG